MTVEHDLSKPEERKELKDKVREVNERSGKGR